MSTEEERKYDSDKLNRFLADEIGQMPFVFKMNGCKFRWDVFKMAYEMSHPKSLSRIINTSQEIIDWVNDETKPLTQTTPSGSNTVQNTEEK